MDMDLGVSSGLGINIEPLYVCIEIGVVQVSIVTHVILIVAGQTIHYFIIHTIDVHDSVVEAGEELPPSYLSVWQVLLGLEIFEALMVSY